VEVVQLRQLAVAALVEAVAHPHRAELDSMVGEHAGDRRSATAVHAQDRHDRLAAQRLRRLRAAADAAQKIPQSHRPRVISSVR
jgi:hypothetical protein